MGEMLRKDELKFTDNLGNELKNLINLLKLRLIFPGG